MHLKIYAKFQPFRSGSNMLNVLSVPVEFTTPVSVNILNEQQV